MLLISFKNKTKRTLKHVKNNILLYIKLGHIGLQIKEYRYMYGEIVTGQLVKPCISIV